MLFIQCMLRAIEVSERISAGVYTAVSDGVKNTRRQKHHIPMDTLMYR